MGRRSRRLHVRLARATAAAAAAAFVYQRWQLRPFGLQPASAYTSNTSSTIPHSSAQPVGNADGAGSSTPGATRADRWSQLRTSSPDSPFDVCVIGGGLTGLYTAVDAAQRGLRVALVEAADLGGGTTTSHMPAVSPGAFPYVQRALRQRDTSWLRVAMTVLAEETTWRQVAAACVHAPDTTLQRAQKRLQRMAGTGGDVAEFGVSPSTTLLPALHTSEMAEYACAAVLGTLLSVFCGPLQPTSLLSSAAVGRRLPALAPRCTTAASASTTNSNADSTATPADMTTAATTPSASSPSTSAAPTIRVKGGAVTNNLSLESHAVAVALAATAEELGVTLCTYAPAVRIREATTEARADAAAKSCDSAAADGNNIATTNQRSKTSWWPWGRRQPAQGSGPDGAALLAVHVHDALSDSGENGQAAMAQGGASQRSTGNLWGFVTSLFTSQSPSDAVCTDSHAVAFSQRSDARSCAPVASTRAVVYARSVVNCAGCGVDEVKSLFDENGRDTVPAAFEGFCAYSYLVAPADAVTATLPRQSCSNDDKNNSASLTLAETAGDANLREDKRFDAAQKPLSLSTGTTGVHFSSPRLSFASAMVLPWWDRCVLLGPSISPLPHLRPSAFSDAPSESDAPHRTRSEASSAVAGALEGGYVVQSKDGYAAQCERVESMLASCGVTVNASRVLSCVTQIVPYVKSPAEVPFARELLGKGYALHFSSVPAASDTASGPSRESELARTNVSESQSAFVKSDGAGEFNGDGGQQQQQRRRDVALLHVYGGTPVLARRVAQDAVDALVRHEPSLYPAECQARLHACRTRRLRLTVPQSLMRPGTSTPSASAGDAVARLQSLIRDTNAERLVDVVARRTHVAFTSPEDALTALPALAAVMQEVKSWTAARTAVEVAAAQRFIAAVAVAPPSTTA